MTRAAIQPRHRRWIVLAALAGLLALAPDGAAQPTPTPDQTLTGKPADTEIEEPTPDESLTGTPAEPPEIEEQDPVEELTGDPSDATTPPVGPQPGQEPDTTNCDDDDDGLLSQYMPKLPTTECMTERAVRTVFGMPGDGWITKPLLSWILKVPDFVSTPGRGIGDAEWAIEAIAFALLLGIVTFVLLHYWATGLTSQGGGTVLIDGVLRCAGAGMLILAWPFVFERAAEITNATTAAILPDAALDASIGVMAGIGAVIGGATGGIAGSLIVGIAVILAFLLLFLGLLLMKIGLTAGLLLAFLGMPLALALWPLPATSGPAGYAVRFVGMVFSTVVMWALCLRVYASVNSEFITWGGDVEITQKLVLPLIGIAELGVLFAIPRHAVAMWNVTSGGRGIIATTASNVASSLITNAVTDRFRNRPGGKQGTPGNSPTGQRPAAGSPAQGGPAGRTPAGGKPKPGTPENATPGGGAPPAGSGQGGPGAGQQQGTPGGGRAAGAGPRPPLGAHGLPTASGSPHEAGARQAAMNLRSRQAPSIDQVSDAIARVSRSDNGRYAVPLRNLLGNDGGGTAGGPRDRQILSTLASASVAPHVTPRSTLDFRTIAAATPRARRAALQPWPTGQGPATPPPRNP